MSDDNSSSFFRKVFEGIPVMLIDSIQSIWFKSASAYDNHKTRHKLVKDRNEVKREFGETTKVVFCNLMSAVSAGVEDEDILAFRKGIYVMKNLASMMNLGTDMYLQNADKILHRLSTERMPLLTDRTPKQLSVGRESDVIEAKVVSGGCKIPPDTTVSAHDAVLSFLGQAPDIKNFS